jgi:hypothetical protein
MNGSKTNIQNSPSHLEISMGMISSIETSGKGNDTPAYTPGINEEIQTK